MSDANNSKNSTSNGNDTPVADNQDILETFLTEVSFEQFDLPPAVRQGLAAAGFTFCTPIQAQTLPLTLAGRDIAGQAQTGTGKTAAFLITIFTRLLQLEPAACLQPAALIVAPTRELACQIHDETILLGAHTGLSSALIIGGVDYLKQADILRQGVDIVIGTPGRIIDYIKQGIFITEHIKMVVVDEADRLLDMGFADDMRFILRKMPQFEKRQTFLFSATLSYRVLDLTYEFMNLPEFISITPKELTVTGVQQTLFHVGLENKLSLLLGLLKREEWQRLIIFVNTKAGVEWLAQKLKGNGYSAEGITGDLPQKMRFKLMEQFKNNQINILLATDVASRGIHVEDITHVINYDLPQDPENYVHRIGRTARAGKTGIALTLACETYVLHLEPLEAMLGYKIPVVWPEDEWLIPDKSAPVKIQRPRPKARSRVKTPKTPKRGAVPKRIPDYFPGTFFGFTAEAVNPDGISAAESDVLADEYVMVINEPADETTSVPDAKASLVQPAVDLGPAAASPENQNAVLEILMDTTEALSEGPSDAADKEATPETPPKKKRRRRYTRRKPRTSKTPAASESSKDT